MSEPLTVAGQTLRTFVRKMPIGEEVRLQLLNEITRCERAAYWQGAKQGRIQARLAAIQEIQALGSPDRFIDMGGSYEQGFSEVAVMRALNPGNE